MTRQSTVRDTVERTLAHARRCNLAFTAAGIAYYAQVSIIPLGVLGFVAISVFAGERLAVQLLDTAGDALSPAGQRLLRDAVTDAAGRSGATAGGALVLAWGALRLFRGIKAAFETVYGSDEGIVIRWHDSVLTGLATAGAVAVAVAGGFALRALGVSLALPVRNVLFTVVLALTLVPLYYLLPAPDVRLREALPGAFVTAGGWVLLRTVFRAYLGVAGQYAVYGALGAILILVTWLYFGSVLLVAGAVVNVVLAGRDVEHESYDS